MTDDGVKSAAGAGITGSTRILKTKVLLGEGKDEVAFFEAMLKHLGRDDIQAFGFNGRTALKGYLKALMLDPKWPEVETVLITRDADFPRENAKSPAAQSAWYTVVDVVRSPGLPAPRAHGELTAEGDRSIGAAPKIGVFILPDGKRDGMLEDLCLAAVADDSVAPCLDAYMQCIGQKGVALAANVMPKARAHAYLASRPVPDKRVGEAAIAGYWPWEAPAFAPLIAFVSSA